jgi:transposase
LRQIGVLYEIEAEIRQIKLSEQAKQPHRLTHSEPRVDTFFACVDQQFEQQGLLPSNPLHGQFCTISRTRTSAWAGFLREPRAANSVGS